MAIILLLADFVHRQDHFKESTLNLRRHRRPAAAAAEDVDSRLELIKVKSWGQKQKKNNRLELKLKTYYREVDILASLNHVRLSA